MTTPPRFQVESHIDGGVARLRVDGEFDLSAVEDFEAKARALLAEGPIEALVVDLRSLTFMDSSGLSELIKLEKAAQKDGFRLAILRPPSPVAAIFEMTGLDQHLPLFDPDTALDDEPNRG